MRSAPTPLESMDTALRPARAPRRADTTASVYASYGAILGYGHACAAARAQGACAADTTMSSHLDISSPSKLHLRHGRHSLAPAA